MALKWLTYAIRKISLKNRFRIGVTVTLSILIPLICNAAERNWVFDPFNIGLQKAPVSMKEFVGTSKSVSGDRSTLSSEPLSLQGVYEIRGIQKAIISSKTVAQGDRIDNFIVQKIQIPKSDYKCYVNNVT